jgi:excisionase family DNA binding protein
MTARVVESDPAIRITTGQAAEMLGVSRQTLVRILMVGELPYSQPSKHRYLLLADVLRYKADHEWGDFSPEQKSANRDFLDAELLAASSQGIV